MLIGKIEIPEDHLGDALLALQKFAVSTFTSLTQSSKTWSDSVNCQQYCRLFVDKLLGGNYNLIIGWHKLFGVIPLGMLQIRNDTGGPELITIVAGFSESRPCVLPTRNFYALSVDIYIRNPLLLTIVR